MRFLRAFFDIKVALYFLFAGTFLTSVIFLPLFSERFSGSAQTASIFIACIPGAYAAIYWPGLRPLHIFILIPAVAIMQLISILVYTLIHSLSPANSIEDYSSFFHPELVTGLIKTVVLQGAVSLFVSAGVWMRKGADDFYIRRAAHDDEELTELYSLKKRLADEPNLTYFKYKTLLAKSHCLVGVRKNVIQMCVSGARLSDSLFIFDLLVRPESVDTNSELMIREILRHARLAEGAFSEIYGFSGSGDSIEPFIRSGFSPVDPADIDANLRLRKILSEFEITEFEDWKPFSNPGFFVRFREAP